MYVNVYTYYTCIIVCENWNVIRSFSTAVIGKRLQN